MHSPDVRLTRAFDEASLALLEGEENKKVTMNVLLGGMELVEFIAIRRSWRAVIKNYRYPDKTVHVDYDGTERVCYVEIRNRDTRWSKIDQLTIPNL